MGTVIKNRGTSCVGVRKTGTTLIRVSTVMGTLYGASKRTATAKEKMKEMQEIAKSYQKGGDAIE